MELGAYHASCHIARMSVLAHRIVFLGTKVQWQSSLALAIRLVDVGHHKKVAVLPTQATR